MADAPTCPDCGGVVDRHWSITMSYDDAVVWLHDDTVCAKTRDEVHKLLRDEPAWVESERETVALSVHESEPERMSTCALCGETKVANPKSPYFAARPDRETDADWDGCVQGMGT